MGDWQLIVVLWGDKYPEAEVNYLIENAIAQSQPHPKRVTVLTDRARPGIHPSATQRAIPDFFLNPQFLGGGCQAKLCIFEEGIIPDDVTAIYVDIDTVILGNLARLTSLLRTPATIAVLEGAFLPFGRLARALFRISRGRLYARGNSSVVVFNPRPCTPIATRFREAFARHGASSHRPMVADDRFISWTNQAHMRLIPKSMAIKFTGEFMLPWPWAIYARARLPWVRRRWSQLIAITLSGTDVKRDELMHLCEGQTLTDRKGRMLIWSETAMGSIKPRILAYYQKLQQELESWA
jgi:hypothetical protein